MPINFSQDQSTINVTATVKDNQGNPAQIQNPRWESSNPDLVTVAGTTDMTVILQHGRRDATGICQLVFICDADLGEGVVALNHSEDVEVNAGQGAVVTFEVQ